MSDTRYDVAYGDAGPYPTPHFCREGAITENGDFDGCFGFNPEHGIPWEEVREEISDWHATQAEYWKTAEESNHTVSPDDYEYGD